MANNAESPEERKASGLSVSMPLWILAVIAAAFFLRESRGLFVPLALGFLASYVLQPVVSQLDRLGTPRVLNATFVVGVVVGVVGWVGWSLSDDFTRAARELPQQVREIRAELRSSQAGGTLGQLEQAAREMQGAGGAPGRATAPDGISQVTGPLASYLWQGSFGLLTAAGQLTMIVFFVLFLLTSAEQWRSRLIAIAGNVLSSRRTGIEVLDEINWQVQRFLFVHLITSVIVAVATGLAVLALGGPAPAFWGAAAGVFNWVPYFGPVIISGGLAVAGFVAGGLTMALQLAGVALVITSIEGWLITPPLLGRAARMSTLAVFVSLLFWSWVWGIWGTILAVPLTSMIKAVSDHVEPLEWLSRLLGEDPGRAHQQEVRATSGAPG
jgi:predicted PurR-regulated permease PerM